jgi:hypothetical protein
MKKTLIALWVATTTCVCFAELSKKELIMLKVLEVGELKTTIKKIYKKVQADDTKMPSTHIVMLARDLNIYCIHPFVEADTAYSRKWFVSVKKALDELADARAKQEAARVVRNTTLYKKGAMQYNQDLRKLIQLLKHPVKVEKTRLKSLRKEARLKRRALERKLNE